MNKLIVANWKMNLTLDDSINLFNKFVEANSSVNFFSSGIELVFCPSFTSLESFHSSIILPNVFLGAQNMFFEDKGAFTGEISPLMLKELGVKYVLLGHSERRIIFNESNELINKKILNALKHKLIPILCIGESFKEKKENQTFNVLRTQLIECLKGVKLSSSEQLVIAYEPVYAISSFQDSSEKLSASIKDIRQAVLIIRKQLISFFGKKGANILILYGGSVSPENSKQIASLKNIQGLLIGSASLNPSSLSKIVKSSLV